MTMPYEEEPVASVSPVQRTASQLGYVPRHAAPAEPGIAGVHVQQPSMIAPVSALSDPWNSGASMTGGQLLTNRELLRRRGGAGMLAGPSENVESPVGDVEGALSDVLGPDPGGVVSAARLKAQRDAANERWQPREPINDAQPQEHGVFSDGESMVHIRPMTGPTGGHAGRYMASPVGGPGQGAVPPRGGA